MRLFLTLAWVMNFTFLAGQQTYTTKHFYKTRLRTMENHLQRGIITAIDDSTITILWQGKSVSYTYRHIKKLSVFRKGTVGKLMLVTAPATIAGGLAISRNQTAPNNATRWLNNFAAVNLGFIVGAVEAAIIGMALRKTFHVQGDDARFAKVLRHITGK